MSAQAYPDVCVIFDAYRLDQFTLAHFEAYVAALEELCRVVFVFHGNNISLDALPTPSLLLTDDEIFGKNKCLKGSNRKLIPGNCDLKTLVAIEKLPGYKKYISIEFDAICVGNIKETIKELILASSDFDLAGSYIGTVRDAPDWMWWSSILPPDGVTVNKQDYRKSFLPVGVYSYRFARLYREALSSGWVGHQEVLVPTIALINRCSILDLSVHSRRFTRFPQFQAKWPEQLTGDRKSVV